MDIDERAIYVATILILVAASGVLIVATESTRSTGPTPPDAATNEFRVTEDGTRYIVAPANLVQGCPGGKDCIPSIDEPSFQPGSTADWLKDDDLVIGVEINGDVRAYPLRILNLHEIVNDNVGGQPIAVTYCPLCRSGLVFDRRVAGGTLTFGVSGKLLNANLIMYDRQTETYWSQINGTAVVGPLVPAELTIVSNTITTWEMWEAAHPETKVLSRNTGIYPVVAYGSNSYAGYRQSEEVGFGVSDVDDRLPSKRIVYGVTIGDSAMAYPEQRVREADVINDVVGEVPILVLEDQQSEGIAVFVRSVDGDARRFRLEGDTLVDQTGTEWSFDGDAISGPDAGAQLERLNSHGMFWFAWSKFHPDTGVYGMDSTESE